MERNGEDADLAGKQSLMSNESRIYDDVPQESYDELTDEQKQEVRALYEKLRKNSRWLPDSALTTYFGMPAFHAYGNASTKGALGPNTYMKTHNINPHAGQNKPVHSQVHGGALLGGSKKVKAPGSLSPKIKPVALKRRPHPPRMPTEKFKNMSKAQTAKLDKRKIEAKNSGAIGAQTFKDAQAIQYKIMPPSFSSKHLKAKKKIIDLETETAERKRQEILEQRQQGLDSKRSGAQVKGQPESEQRSQQSQKTQESERKQPAKKAEKASSGKGSTPPSSTGRTAQQSQPEELAGSSKTASWVELPRTAEMPTFAELDCNPQSANEFLLLDPKNYKYLPAKYTENIRAAGRQTAQSEQVGALFKA